MNFSEYEAVALAAFSRYVNVAYFGVWVFVVILLLFYLQRYSEQKNILIITLLSLMVAITPMEYIYNMTLRNHIDQAIETRQKYMSIENKILDECKAGARVYLISQEDTGYDSVAMRFITRPCRTSGGSIGEPFFEGDIWTREITATQWMEELVSDYDYVALYKLNDYFYQNFSVLFENPEDIAENELYYVDKEKELLVKCDFSDSE